MVLPVAGICHLLMLYYPCHGRCIKRRYKNINGIDSVAYPFFDIMRPTKGSFVVVLALKMLIYA